MTASTDLRRIQELDALRGIAALLVVVFHYTTRYDEIYQHSFEHADRFELLQFGVQFFFMISGFVIYLTTQRVSGVGDFLYRRFTRLYPTYWMALCLTFGIVCLFGLPGKEATVSTVLWNLTMFQGLVGKPHVDGAYWSLLPELMFYLLMSVLLLVKKANYLWSISIVWMVLMLGKTLGGWSSGLLPTVLNLRYGMLFLSGMHFYALFKGERNGGHHLFILLSFWLCTLRYHEIGEQSLLLGFFSVFYLFVYGQLEWLAYRPLLWLGQISYALYLLHQNIGYIIINALKETFGYTSWWMLLIPLAGTVLLAHLLTFYLEQPLIKWMRRKRI